MKKLFISTIVLMGVFFFASCGGKEPTPAGDVTPPVIVLPIDASTLVVNLGDKDAVMKDVTARDDEDGNITSSIELNADLDVIGETEVEYVVFDKAKNKTIAKRKVMIRSGKLAKKYFVEPIDVTGEHEITVTESETVNLQIESYLFGTTKPTYVPDGKGKLKMREFGAMDGGRPCTFSGNVKYEKVGDNTYNIVSMEYTATYNSGTPATKTYSFTSRPK